MEQLHFTKQKKKTKSLKPNEYPKIYAYFRGSNDRIEKDNQKYEIEQWCAKKGYKIDYFLEETVSGGKHHTDRQLSGLLEGMNNGDTLIVSELSRLARSTMNLMEILSFAMEKGIMIKTVKGDYELGDNITSKVLAFAFGLAAEIERKMISERTKVALALKKSQGVILGRPRGIINQKKKLDGQEGSIIEYLNKNLSVSAIARILGCHRLTLAAFIREKNLVSDRTTTNAENITSIKRPIKKTRKPPGRPMGAINNTCILDGKENEMQELLNKGLTISAIAALYDVSRFTIAKFINKRDINYVRKKKIKLNVSKAKVDIKNINRSSILDGKEGEIIQYLKRDVPVTGIARILGVHRLTLTNFIEKRKLNEYAQ
jgi:DNA invertase Pin-like site-specific DNA recombinase